MTQNRARPVFIPSRLSDNPYLNQNGTYRAFLDGLPDGLREAWRDGSWNDPIIEGAYYTRELQQARAEEVRIKAVAYDPALKVHTVWDLGISDAMAILFVQRTATETRDSSYQNENFGLNHYWQCYSRNKPIKGMCMVNTTLHTMQTRGMGTGQTLIQTAEKMGLVLEQIPMIGIDDGIQKVRLMFPRLYINEPLCEQPLNAWLNYHKVG